MSRQQALFSSGGGNRSSNASKALVEFRAGKMSMSGTLVSPDKRKGMVMVEQGIQYVYLIAFLTNFQVSTKILGLCLRPRGL